MKGAFLVVAVVVGVAPIEPERHRKAEAAAYLTRRMIYRVHVDVCRTRPDGFNHLGEARRASVDSLTAHNGRCDDVGLGEGAADGRRGRCWASLGFWHARRRRTIRA